MFVSIMTILHVKMKKFAVKYLTWEEIYAFEKFLPILCRWQILNPNYVQEKVKTKKSQGLLQPDRIKKTRNPKGLQYNHEFEIKV